MTKKELMDKAREYEFTDAGRTFLQLLTQWIVDLREKNDTAAPGEFEKNQGAIRELKLMRKGIGPKQVSREYNGGFDE